MRVALDSNVLIYAEGSDDDWRSERALDLLAMLPAENVLIPLQAVGETAKWLATRGGRPKPEAMRRAGLWLRGHNTQATNEQVLAGALTLCSDHDLQFWDAVILSSASVGGAALLLTEDMNPGFRWGGVTIVKPFQSPSPPEIDAILGKSRT